MERDCMDNVGDINKPGENVVISSDFKGSIRCRNLEILPGVSVIGTAVVEDTARLAGSFEGVLDTDTFLASPSAKSRGTLYAQNASYKKSDFKMFLDSERQAAFKRETAPVVLHSEELISKAIDDAIASRVNAVVSTPTAIPLAAKAVEPREVQGLAERLASKGLASPLLETPSEPEVAALPVVEPEAVRHSGRMTALPSLV